VQGEVSIITSPYNKSEHGLLQFMPSKSGSSHAYTHKRLIDFVLKLYYNSKRTKIYISL